ncbi:MAG TPA: cytidylate kinase-like family protein [Spirochaetota bacterium]|jgi:cytidylate kinase|nr:cytidylate kinase-like family protein [Spirochaetota bacterium]HPY03691.1 cytidylate kinase-like family protein [Spirochaetota bacterium]HQA53160.1 cytidylate kinase-like family protein [Spirochaetota bacterium]
MKTIFSNYISSKVHDTFQSNSESDNANYIPFITFSREYGCGGDHITQKICSVLSSCSGSDGKVYEWKRINHEVIAEAAAEIGVPAEIVKEMTYQKIDEYFVSSFFNFSFSKYSKPSVDTVRNAIARVIAKFAHEGRVIILGRGGASITRHYKNSLHIRLHAPIEWRVKQVAEREDISIEKAKVLIHKIDSERSSLRNYFEGTATDKTIFDAIYNSMTLSEDEIIESILAIARKKGFIS